MRVSAVSIASSLLMWVFLRVETLRCAKYCSGVLLVNSERSPVPCGNTSEFHLPHARVVLCSAAPWDVHGLCYTLYSPAHRS